LKLVRKPDAFRKIMEEERRKGRSLGFVPTMGALHEGHLSLVRAAKKENDRVAVSIFVNPAQFGPKEDLSKYPRPVARDRRLLEKVKADYLFMPSARDMYPEGFQTYVDPGPIAEGLCGKYRPGHFRGVATVVAKLFQAARPHRAYFGIKDLQQCRVVAQLIRDLDFDIRLRVMPIVREPDGLAMSSRNAYLGTRDRERARAVSQALFLARKKFAEGERNLSRLRRAALDILAPQVDRVQYLEFVDAETLEPLRKARLPMAAAVACYVGKTRLIDNVIMGPSK